MTINECLSHKQLFPEDAAVNAGPSFLRRRGVYECLFLSLQDSQEKNANPVKAEEAKLKAKYPGLGQKPGGSEFLMKRLQKGVGDRGLFTTQSEARTMWRQHCASLKTGWSNQRAAFLLQTTESLPAHT